MAVSEGELYLLDQQVPCMGWDDRAVGTRQRWIVTVNGDSTGSKPFVRREVTADAYEQFIRNTMIKDKPAWPDPLPGTPGSAVQGQAWPWNLLQQVTVHAT